MRKVSNVLAWICTAAIVLATVANLFGVPFMWMVFVLFTGLFAAIALPANLLALFQEKRSRTRRIAQVVGTLAAMHIIIILLFFVQNWPGGELFLYQGALLSLVFVVLLVKGNKQDEEPMQINTTFNKLFFTIVVLLTVLCIVLAIIRSNSNEERTRLEQLNEIENAKCDSVRQVMEVVYFDLFSDDETDSSEAWAKEFRERSLAMIRYIDSVQMMLVTEINYGFASPVMDSSMVLQDPMEVGVPTHYFIGEDIQNPSGKAPEIYAKLADYRNHVLHPDVPFFVPMNSTGEDNLQWVKDNFYKAKAIEVMTRLTLIKENIYQAMLYSIDHNLFVKPQ